MIFLKMRVWLFSIFFEMDGPVDRQAIFCRAVMQSRLSGKKKKTFLSPFPYKGGGKCLSFFAEIKRQIPVKTWQFLLLEKVDFW